MQTGQCGIIVLLEQFPSTWFGNHLNQIECVNKVEKYRVNSWTRIRIPLRIRIVYLFATQRLPFVSQFRSIDVCVCFISPTYHQRQLLISVDAIVRGCTRVFVCLHQLRQTPATAVLPDLPHASPVLIDCCVASSNPIAQPTHGRTIDRRASALSRHAQCTRVLVRVHVCLFIRFRVLCNWVNELCSAYKLSVFTEFVFLLLRFICSRHVYRSVWTREVIGDNSGGIL